MNRYSELWRFWIVNIWRFRVAREAGTRPKLEPGGLLPNAEGRRPADVLLLSTPLLKQNEWQRFPQIALDFALVSPYTAVAIGRQSPNPASAAAVYAETKRQDKGILQACHAQQLGFEPIVFETTGGCEQRAHRLLKSLCQEYDRNQGRKSGVTKSILKGRISIDIQWGISFMLGRCRANHGSGDAGGGIIPRFLQECLS